MPRSSKTDRRGWWAHRAACPSEDPHRPPIGRYARGVAPRSAGRSLGHLIEIATVLRERGVFLRSLTEGFDTSTASGRLLYHVLGAVAEFEREVIKERTVAGMKSR